MPGPGTWVAGDILTAADLNAIGTWTTYTPTVTQSTARTATINYAAYCKINNLCAVIVDLTITNTGTAGNDLLVTLPFAISTPGATGSTKVCVGSGLFYDASATDVILVSVMQSSTSSNVRFSTDTSTSDSTSLGTSPSLAVANGDVVSFSAVYQVA